MTLVRHELRQGTTAFAVWAGSIAGLLAICIFLFPEMKSQMEAVNSVFASMGSFTAAFGMDRINFGTFIGFFGVEPMGRGRAAHNASFGIAIVRSCWHLGIGAIFMAIATDFAKTAGYHKLCLDVRADNERAIKLYRRFGFSECGLRKEHILINGEYFDEMIMELML